jgi:hypothetical protein
MGVTEARDEAIGATFEGHRRDDGQPSSRLDRPIVTTRSTDRHDNYLSSRRQRVIDTTLVNYHHDDGDLSMRPHLVDIVTMVTCRRDANQ